MEHANPGSKYVGRPNLLRVAVELTKCKNPDKALGAMRLVLKGGVDNSANSQENLSLPIG